MGNQGETMISTPSSMPNQSSQGRCVFKKRKSDMVNLPCKEAYVNGRRSLHSDQKRPSGRIGGVCLLKDVGSSPSPARPSGRDFGQPAESERAPPGCTKPSCALRRRFVSAGVP